MKNNFEWTCKLTWKRSAYNTLWCLIGCSIGDFGTIAFFSIAKYSLAYSLYHDFSNH